MVAVLIGALRVSAGETGLAVGAVSPASSALHSLCAIARERNPDVQAALERVRQGVAARKAVEGFFDPVVSAAGGYAERDPALPVISRAFGWIGDATWTEGGIERAFAPGWHAGLGASVRQRRPVGDGPETLAGAYVRVPLLRDRGFALQKAELEAADYESVARACHALRTLLEVERDLALRFTDLQLAYAQQDVAQAATARAERLLSDAEQMANLGAIPAHQLNPARMEVARRREEETAARRSVETARRRLAEWIGRDDLPPGVDAPTDLIAWARTTRPPEALATSNLIGQRPDYQALQAEIRAAEVRLARARLDRRSDLSAHAVVAWRDGPESDAADDAGWAVGLAWRKTFGDRAGAAREAEARARIAELREQARALERAVAADAAVAFTEFDAAARRLDLIVEAVETARATLAAENERFQLGDGTSRQTLDAQKDLTDVIRRRNDIAAELLRARFRWTYAVGLSPAGDATPDKALYPTEPLP